MAYIDREKFAEAICNFPAIDEDAANAVISLLHRQTTADVAEVKHGYWITDENGIVICSECGEEHAWDEYRATYCEDCGAKMDGGKK